MPNRRRFAPLWPMLLSLGAIFLLAAWAWSQELSEYGNPFTWVTIGPVQVKAEVVQSRKNYTWVWGKEKPCRRAGACCSSCRTWRPSIFACEGWISP